MASVGDVTLSLRAETQQFQQGIRGASTSLRQIRTDIAQAAVAFKRGALDTEGLSVAFREAQRQAQALGATAQANVRGAIASVSSELRIAGNTTRLTAAELQAAERAYAGTAVAAETAAVATRTARQGLGTMRSTLASLSATMIGARGTAGTLVGALLQFGVGNAVAVGILAGIAGMVTGFRLLTSTAREAAAAAKEAGRNALSAFQNIPQVQRRDLIRQRAGVAEQLREAETDLARVIGEMRALREVGAEVNPALQREFTQTSGTVTELRQQVHGFDEQLKHLDDSAKTAAEHFRDLIRAASLRIIQAADFRELLNLERAISEQLARGNLSLTDRIRLTEQLRSIQGTGFAAGGPAGFLTPQGPAESLGLRQTVPSRVSQRGTPYIPPLTEQIKQAMEEASRIAGTEGQKAGTVWRRNFADTEADTKLGLQVGTGLIRGLIRSIIDNKLSFRDVLLQSLETLFEEAFVQALRSALSRSKGKGSLLGDLAQVAAFITGTVASGGNPAVGAGAAGLVKQVGGSSKSVVAPSLIVNVPPAADPITLARDAQWQNALRESLLVARSQGFRFA